LLASASGLTLEVRLLNAYGFVASWRAACLFLGRQMTRSHIRRRSITAAIIGVVAMGVVSAAPAISLRDEGRAPDFGGAVEWMNSPPLNRGALQGKVVLAYFWTYTCINSLRPLPYIKSWAAAYRDSGLVVVGVHTPEFSFEHDRDNVLAAVHGLNVAFPVAVDSEYRVWRAFNNEYWPALYFVDRKGHIRHHQFGEGAYEQSEQVIQELLREDGTSRPPAPAVRVVGQGIEAPPSDERAQSPETYVGYVRTERFASRERFGRDVRKTYTPPANLSRNQWALNGSWDVNGESARSQAAGSKILYRFHGRDLHLVLRPANAHSPIRFRVTLDGHAPGADHGVDCDAEGNGEIREPRLYQLVRQKQSGQDRTFAIEFLDPGAEAFVFTFG
jgi:thiol-disulfide isomerase/thioredoxin